MTTRPSDAAKRPTMTLSEAVLRMNQCRQGCDQGEPFYADPYAWDAIQIAIAFDALNPVGNGVKVVGKEGDWPCMPHDGPNDEAIVLTWRGSDYVRAALHNRDVALRSLAAELETVKREKNGALAMLASERGRVATLLKEKS